MVTLLIFNLTDLINLQLHNYKISKVINLLLYLQFNNNSNLQIVLFRDSYIMSKVHGKVFEAVRQDCAAEDTGLMNKCCQIGPSNISTLLPPGLSFNFTRLVTLLSLFVIINNFIIHTYIQ